MCFFVQTNHTRKELLFLMFKEINLRNHSSLHKLFYSLKKMEIVEQHIKMAKKHNKIIGKKYKTEIKHSAIQSKIFTNASEVKYTGNNYLF